MPNKHGQLDVDNIKKHIVEFTEQGLTDDVILNKLEEMGLTITVRTLNLYRAKLGEEIVKIQEETRTGVAMFYRDLLERALNKKINNAKRAIPECQTNAERDMWHDVIIETLEKLYLLKDSVVQGIETKTRPLEDHSTTGSGEEENPSQDTSNKEYTQSGCTSWDSSQLSEV